MRNLVFGVAVGMLLTMIGYAGAALVSYTMTRDDRAQCESIGAVYIHEVRGCVVEYDDGMAVVS
jgi:hypothetical protein